MAQLQAFAVRALRQVPTSLWWVLGLLLGAAFSIILEKELFPHTPAAAQVAHWVMLGCALLLPPLGAVVAWRVAAQVEHSGWLLLGYLVAVGATGFALLLSLLFVVLGVMALF